MFALGLVLQINISNFFREYSILPYVLLWIKPSSWKSLVSALDSSIKYPSGTARMMLSTNLAYTSSLPQSEALERRPPCNHPKVTTLVPSWHVYLSALYLKINAITGDHTSHKPKNLYAYEVVQKIPQICRPP